MFSIVMPYHNRAMHLQNTIDSYRKLYKHKYEFEVVIVDDSPEDPSELLNLMAYNHDIQWNYYIVNRSNIKFRNPAVLYNLVISKAKYENIIITNPENIHVGDVLGVVAKELESEIYLVFGCRTIKYPYNYDDLLENIESHVLYDDPDGKHGWYQHSVYNNRMLHFLSAIKKEDYLRIEGFDKNYDKGFAVEDNDFICKILNGDFKVKLIDEPYACHQDHGRPAAQIVRPEFIVNMELFIKKWHGQPNEIHAKLLEEKKNNICKK